MLIKKISQNNLKDALDLCTEVFMEYEAPVYTKVILLVE